MNALEELGEALAKEAAALLKNAKAEDKLDVFKAVSSFYLGMAGKRPAKAPEAVVPNGKPKTFTDLVEPIRQNGGRA